MYSATIVTKKAVAGRRRQVETLNYDSYATKSVSVSSTLFFRKFFSQNNGHNKGYDHD